MTILKLILVIVATVLHVITAILNRDKHYLPAIVTGLMANFTFMIIFYNAIVIWSRMRPRNKKN